MPSRILEVPSSAEHLARRTDAGRKVESAQSHSLRALVWPDQRDRERLGRLADWAIAGRIR
jgi:hypothetical protein